MPSTPSSYLLNILETTKDNTLLQYYISAALLLHPHHPCYESSSDLNFATALVTALRNADPSLDAAYLGGQDDAKRPCFDSLSARLATVTPTLSPTFATDCLTVLTEDPSCDHYQQSVFNVTGFVRCFGSVAGTL